LKKGGTGLKVPLLKGDLGGSATLDGSTHDLCVHLSLKKGGTGLKVPLLKGDLGEAATLDGSTHDLCVHLSLHKGDQIDEFVVLKSIKRALL